MYITFKHTRQICFRGIKFGPKEFEPLSYQCETNTAICQTDRDHFQSNWSLQMETDEIYLQKKLFQKHKTFPIKKRELIFLR